MDVLHIRLGEKMLSEMDEVMKCGLYANKTEFIREAIRKAIYAYKSELAWRDIEKAQGMIQHRPNTKTGTIMLTDEEKDEFMAEYMKKRGWDPKKFGLG